jgi:hypothetical protein
LIQSCSIRPLVQVLWCPLNSPSQFSQVLRPQPSIPADPVQLAGPATSPPRSPSGSSQRRPPPGLAGVRHLHASASVSRPPRTPAPRPLLNRARAACVLQPPLPRALPLRRHKPEPTPWPPPPGHRRFAALRTCRSHPRPPGGRPRRAARLPAILVA